MLSRLGLQRCDAIKCVGLAVQLVRWQYQVLIAGSPASVAEVIRSREMAVPRSIVDFIGDEAVEFPV